MSAAHTPGPWTAKNISGAGWGVWADLRPALGETFSKDFPLNGSDALKTQQIQISYETWVQFPSEDFNAMQGANTVLMAAAPDLLAASQAALSCLNGEHDTNSAHQNAMDLLVAALAKATGAAS